MGKSARKNQVPKILASFLVATAFLISCQVRESSISTLDVDVETLSGSVGPLLLAEAVPQEKIFEYKINLSWYPRPNGKIKITRTMSYTKKENDDGKLVIATLDASEGSFIDTFTTPEILQEPINEVSQPTQKAKIKYLIESVSADTLVLNGLGATIDAPRDCRVSRKKIWELPPKEYTWPCWRVVVEDRSRILVDFPNGNFTPRSFAVENGGTVKVRFTPTAKTFQFILDEASGAVRFEDEGNTDIMALAHRPDHFRFEFPPGHHNFSVIENSSIKVACKEGFFEGTTGNLYRNERGVYYLLGNDANLFRVQKKTDGWFSESNEAIRLFDNCSMQDGEPVIAPLGRLKMVNAKTLEEGNPFPAIQEQIKYLNDLNAIYALYNRYFVYLNQPGFKIGVTALQNKFLHQLQREPSYFLRYLDKVGYLYVGSFRTKEITQSRDALFIPAEIDLNIENNFHRFLRSGP